MVLGRTPHAVLFVGPGSVGKTTLALDLAAGLLCRAPDASERPCRECRGCRLVASGNHPDLHRLAPEGPGGQVRIGSATAPEQGTVRHLIGELSLLPAEGGARVAIVEQAHRLNDDAQNALLKMLEEPPAGVTIILCADDEQCLLPTVRSRCVRIRVGAASIREIERWLDERGFADAPRAARLARLAGGRPGLALAYARSTDAERLRGEIARALLDMLAEGRHVRLAAVRELMKSAAALDSALEAGRRGESSGEAAGETGPGSASGAATRRRKGRGLAQVAVIGAAETATAGGAAVSAATDGDEASTGARDGAAREAGGGDSNDGAGPKLAASDRRSAAATLMDIWASIGRDLAVARSGGARQLREIGLVDEIPSAAATIELAGMSAFLSRLSGVARQLDDNVNPELALDVLALTWPRSAVAPKAPADGARR
jgi:DNA polymerase III delta' subunit